MSTYAIGFTGCHHLGYAANGMRMNKATRWNQRIVDGHYAHAATMQSMIEHEVDGVVDGGDLSHFNKPVPRDIEVANRVDDLRASAGIWGVGNSGNHCAGGGSDISAMGVMHRPGLGMVAVYPDPSRGKADGVGPFPGLYEIHTSETIPGLPDGIALHLVSHYGLSRHLPEAGIDIDPVPLPGHVNVLLSHGTFESDERLYACINPHGEERAIPHEWVTRGWEAIILSHYHTLGAIPGFGEGDRGQVWYTGSSLRRGFSDDPGQRGWLKVTVHDTGHVKVESVPIWQRPQYDLAPIDAAELTIAEIDDLVTDNLASVAMCDTQSLNHTGDGGAIVRQKVTNATATQRRQLGELRGRYLNLAAEASHWTGLVFERNADQQPATASQVGRREFGARVTDFGTDLRLRADRLVHTVGVPDRLKDPVFVQAMEWADEVSTPAGTVVGDDTAGTGVTVEEVGSERTSGGHADVGELDQ